MVVVKKERESIMKKNKKKLKLKYWFMREKDNEIIRERALKRYYKMKNE